MEYFDSTDCDIQLWLRDMFKSKRERLEEERSKVAMEMDAVCPDSNAGNCIHQWNEKGSLRNILVSST